MTAPPPPPGADPGSWQALHRPFRPRAGRIVPWLAATAWVSVLAAVAWSVPGATVADTLGFAAAALAGTWVFSCFARVRAVPSGGGLDVRNLLGVRSVAWTQVVAVIYGRDSTFVHLDLNDGTTMSVLAVQKSDGAHAEREASRLATLVEVHSRTV